MNDEVIQKILNYANEHLFEPGGNWPKSAIMERVRMKSGLLMKFYWPLWIIRCQKLIW